MGNVIPDNWDMDHNVYSFHVFMEVSFVEPESVPHQDYSDGKNVAGRIRPDSEVFITGTNNKQREITAKEFANELGISLNKLAEIVVDQQIEQIEAMIWQKTIDNRK